MKRITVKKPILQNNDVAAAQIRRKLDQAGIFAVNIMASPGAGKTSVILETITALNHEYRIAVIEGDVVDIDVNKVKGLGVPVSLANTGGACHLDAWMVERSLRLLPLRHISLLIVENVGNLICPANFAIGTHKNVVIASVPEGDDKPLKYPGMFRGADVVILNKTDYLKHSDFDMQKFSKSIKTVNPDVTILPLSCKNKSGVNDWISWIKQQADSRL